ncbi:MAG: hypothetical protein IGS39_11135 [Calothrix sp. C42_A2020_038]|nr:hypothetical protein [Calothrix sp. C42_A2020_038]
MQQKKIAFVHYPHHVNAARLDTMPFALNSVIYLAKMGWSVDLYLWEEKSDCYDNLLPDTVNINYLKDSKFSLQSKLNQIRSILLAFQFQSLDKYYCVFGLGQIGAYLANIIAKSSKCPFVYFNDEFPSCWLDSHWAKLERQAVRDAVMIVLPDPQRFYHLSKELDVSTKPNAFLPNIPIQNLSVEKINWHEKLRIPKDSIPILHAGSIDEHKQIPEILASVPYWHEKAVLILHSRFNEGLKIYRKQLSHLEVDGKVFWSYEPMSERQLNSLVSYCAANFALYRNTGPNIEYTGFSSGKLMRSLIFGSPIIASKLSSFAFIKDYRLGVLVNHSVEIPAAIEEIIYNRQVYSQNCLDFCQTIVSFENAWQKFCDQLQYVNINL